MFWSLNTSPRFAKLLLFPALRVGDFGLAKLPSMERLHPPICKCQPGYASICHQFNERIDTFAHQEVLVASVKKQDSPPPKFFCRNSNHEITNIGFHTASFFKVPF